MGKRERQRKERQKQWLILIGVVIALVAAGYGVVQFLNPVQVVSVRFVNPDGSRSSGFSLEMARTPQAQEKGLMYRRELDAYGGMIFEYPGESVQSFWMKNTYVSLDMVFLDSGKRVVGLLKKVPILNEEPRRVDKPSQYVVELGAGAADREHIVVGSRAEW